MLTASGSLSESHTASPDRNNIITEPEKGLVIVLYEDVLIITVAGYPMRYLSCVPQ